MKVVSEGSCSSEMGQDEGVGGHSGLGCIHHLEMDLCSCVPGCQLAQAISSCISPSLSALCLPAKSSCFPELSLGLCLTPRERCSEYPRLLDAACSSDWVETKTSYLSPFSTVLFRDQAVWPG